MKVFQQASSALPFFTIPGQPSSHSSRTSCSAITSGTSSPIFSKRGPWISPFFILVDRPFRFQVMKRRGPSSPLVISVGVSGQAPLPDTTERAIFPWPSPIPFSPVADGSPDSVAGSLSRLSLSMSLDVMILGISIAGRTMSSNAPGLSLTG